MFLPPERGRNISGLYPFEQIISLHNIRNAVMNILLSLLSSFLLILSFPTFDIEFLAWFALVPLLIALRNKNLKSAFGLSFLSGIGFFMGIFYWINIIDGFSMIEFLLLGVYLGSYFGLFGFLLNFMSEKNTFPHIVTAPSLWVATEYIRSHADFLSLPWGLLGHSQYLNIHFIQIASFTGVYGISFLLVMVNVAVCEAILSLIAYRKKKAFMHSLRFYISSAITIVFIVSSYIYGIAAAKEQPDDKKMQVTVIQGNIPQSMKWKPELLKLHIKKHVALSEEAARARTSLIIWPETAVQGFLPNDRYLLDTFSSLAHTTRTHFLVGGSQRPKFVNQGIKNEYRYNSAFLISPEGAIVRFYNKIRLLPFGEYIPYEKTVPWPKRYIGSTSNYLAGNSFTLFNIQGIKFGALICWENIFPELFRQFIRNGADFMVNITNEAWFGDTAAPYQFVSMSVFRAVENRISIVRCGNTGISCFIDPFGRITGRVTKDDKDIFVGGFLTKEILLISRRTFYSESGDVFFYSVAIMTMFMLIAIIFKVIWRCYGGYKS